VTRLGAGTVLVDGNLVVGDVDIADGQVIAITGPSRGSDRVVAPGFVDLQINGFVGVDFSACSPGDLGRAAEALWQRGTTAFHPTLVTGPVDRTCAALATVDEAQRLGRPPGRALVMGAHLEGPFLSAARLGAHDGAHRVEPDVDLLATLLAAGPVGRMTLAPELDHSLDLVESLLLRSVAVAAGHSNATAEEAHRGFDAGIRSVTHLGNAMAPFHQRAPGLFGASLVRDDVTPTLIADGAHVADDVVRLVFAATGGRVALVSDAVSPAHAGAVPVRARAARNDDGDLIGGLLTIAEMVRHVVELGINPSTALAAGSSHPRRLASLPHASGLQLGAEADLVVLDGDLGLIEVIDPYA